MTTSEVITSAWGALREEQYSQEGFYERRIFANTGRAIFAVLARPTNLVQVHFHLALPSNAIPKLEMKGVALKGETLAPGKIRIRLELLSGAYEGIFSALASDVVERILPAKSDSQVMQLLILRMKHWQKFLQTADAEGLPPEKQVGLFGELTFLLTALSSIGNAEAMLSAWKGPAAGNHDFSHDGRAVEVKTGTSNATDSVSISNEQQLEDHGLVSLYLFHLCLDARADVGASLPTLVALIRSQLPEELHPQFSDLLLASGYVEMHSGIYESRRYIERRRTFYRVAHGFPRILPSQLAPGISDVRYKINLSGCKAFKCTEADVLKDYSGKQHE